MKLSQMLALLIVFGLSHSVFAQTVTCNLNESKSAAMLKKINGGRKKGGVQLVDSAGFQLVISGDKIVGGYLNNSENSVFWELDKGGPDEGQRHAPSYSKRDVQISRGVIKTGLDIDGWDHFNYSIQINTQTGAAEVREGVSLDCLDPYSAFAAYDCQISQ